MPDTSRARGLLIGSLAVTVALGTFAVAQGGSPVIVEVTDTFNCAGGAEVEWTVPPTVTEVTVRMAGGQGGSAGTAGGLGGGTDPSNPPVISVNPGDTYRVVVGCQGGSGGSGGSGGAGFGNGGDGAGSPSSGGGGGASALLDSTGTPLVIAGGGGGGTINGGSFVGSAGGAGGGTQGGAGGDGTGTYQGGGGTQSQPGAGGNVTGISGCPCDGNDGNGHDGGDGSGSGGGGGGGLFGGGGGGLQLSAGTSNLGGGGGGSGFVATGVSGAVVAGIQSGNGFVTLTYDAELDPRITTASVFDLVAGGPMRLTRFDVTNAGGAPALTPELTVSAPSGSGVIFDQTHAEFEIPSGWSCLTSAGGSTITCSGPTLAVGGTATFFLPSAAQASAPAGSVTISAQITSGAAVMSTTAGLQVISQSETVNSATGTGPITAGINDVEGCSIAEAQPTTPEAVAGAGPPGVVFPHGLLDLTITGCEPGATVTFTLTFPEPLPPGTAYWKYGPTPGNASPDWYALPGATIDGATVTYTITDGGLGDDDLMANGTIEDPGGPGVAQAVSTLPVWMLVLVAGLLLGAAWLAMRRPLVRGI